MKWKTCLSKEPFSLLQDKDSYLAYLFSKLFPIPSRRYVEKTPKGFKTMYSDLERIHELYLRFRHLRWIWNLNQQKIGANLNEQIDNKKTSIFCF